MSFFKDTSQQIFVILGKNYLPKALKDSLRQNLLAIKKSVK